MSGLSLPVTRPGGRALIVGAAASRMQSLGILQRLGFPCAEIEDPYAAMIELCRRPLVYRALILSLQNLYREELYLIHAVKQRFCHIEIWLTHTDGRQAALADAMRFGADGLLADDGLHRIAVAATNEAVPLPRTIVKDEAAIPTHPQHSGEMPPSASEEELEQELSLAEPVLSADELRALLQEQPSMPPSGGEE